MNLQHSQGQPYGLCLSLFILLKLLICYCRALHRVAVSTILKFFGGTQQKHPDL